MSPEDLSLNPKKGQIQDIKPLALSAEKRSEFLLGVKEETEGPFNELEADEFLRFAGVPNELIVEEINRVPFVERLQKAVDMGVLANIKGSTWSYLNNRPVVFTKVGGERVPFYRSSEGTGGNKEAGVWYPFFGIGHNHWIIKGGAHSFKTCYDNSALKKVQNILGDTLNWDHELDFIGDKDPRSHPFYAQAGAIKSLCPAMFLDKTLYGKTDLDIFDLDDPSSKHREWIRGILERMYEKYSTEKVDELVKANREKLVAAGYVFKE